VRDPICPLSAVYALMFLRNRDLTKRFIFVGHSLGGAIATLAAAAAIAAFGIKTVPIECHTFGSPRSANAAVAAFFDKYIGQTRGNESQAPGFFAATTLSATPSRSYWPSQRPSEPHAHVSGGVMLPAVDKGWPWAWMANAKPPRSWFRSRCEVGLPPSHQP